MPPHLGFHHRQHQEKREEERTHQTEHDHTNEEENQRKKLFPHPLEQKNLYIRSSIFLIGSISFFFIGWRSCALVSFFLTILEFLSVCFVKQHLLQALHIIFYLTNLEFYISKLRKLSSILPSPIMKFVFQLLVRSQY